MRVDLRHSVRLLCRTPGFTAAAIGTLALGIGASTTLFAVINAVLLRPLPYRDPAGLLLVTGVDRGEEDTLGCLSYPRFTLIAGESPVFAAIAAFAPDSANVTGPGGAEQVRAARVSPAFFEVLGVKPVLGRGFAPGDEKGGRGEVAVISGDLWRRRFNADPRVIGKPITVDSRTRAIVGVMSPEFTFGLIGSRVDVWTPRIDELSLATPEQLHGGTCYLNAIGRLSPRVDRQRAQTHMDVLNRRYLQQFAGLPDADPRRLVLAEPLQERLVGSVRPMLFTMTAAVALVLLIACANVASLLLARGLARRRELAVRTALGASRANVAGQLLSESLLLSLCGGLVGLLISLWGIRGLAAGLGEILPRSEEIAGGLDPLVLICAVGISVFTGVAAGLAPALQVSGRGLLGALRTDDRGATGTRRRTTLRSLLVTAQVALSVVLVVGSGLLVRSFVKLQSVDPGFNPLGTLTMNLSLPSAKYSGRAEMTDFYERLLAKARALPGVGSASLASALPVNATRMTPILAEGQPEVPIAQRPAVIIQTVLGAYLKTMGIPLVRGRAIDERDTATSPAVVVVNQAFARRFFGRRDPVGRHVLLGRRTVPAEIVGVVGDIKNNTLTSAPAPQIDIPFAQLPWASMNLTIRSAADPTRALQPIRAAVAAMDPDLPLTGVQSMEDVLASARSRQKITAALTGMFSLCSLVLAMVGLYGLLAYSVGQRTQELGVRLALGATGAEVTRLVVRQGLTLAAIGAGVGLAASFAVTRWMGGLIYDVSTTDALTFGLSPALFVGLAALASWIPARRAARVDPAVALRA